MTLNTNYAAHLHAFAASATVPRRAFDNAKRCLLDAFGCGLFGASQPWSNIMATQLFAEKSQGTSTVLGHREPLAAERFEIREPREIDAGQRRVEAMRGPRLNPQRIRCSPS